jgi:hypothetical protein
MSRHYPRIRILAESGQLLIREGLSIDFYMRRAHAEVAPAVLRSLDAYLRAVGSQALGWYADEAGSWRKLDAAGWALIRREMLANFHLIFELADVSVSENRYRFAYHGKPLDSPEPGAMSAVSFWLPTEYLEEHGPEQVRRLALEIAALLPFNSGQVGLSFNCETDLVGVRREVRALCFRYPGLDIPQLEWLSWNIGTRLRGPSWLTFLGQPVLGELGGAAGLRARLHSPDTTVRELEGARALVTLGPWPQAGDTERGDVLPAYRELARVLEPWLYHEERSRSLDFPPEDLRRWEHRFLD